MAKDRANSPSRDFSISLPGIWKRCRTTFWPKCRTTAHDLICRTTLFNKINREHSCAGIQKQPIRARSKVVRQVVRQWESCDVFVSHERVTWLILLRSGGFLRFWSCNSGELALDRVT